MSTRKMFFDIAIIGAGPAGIAFASEFANTKTKIIIIEKNTRKIVEKPKIDGREIALTHNSVNILRELGVYRENYQGGNKKAGGALRPSGLNFKRKPTNSYLLEPQSKQFLSLIVI